MKILVWLVVNALALGAAVWLLDGITLTGGSDTDTFVELAAGEAKEPVVIISADANATHQSVVHVMEAARLANILQITFATQNTANK